jgi:hypothetical protein
MRRPGIRKERGTQVGAKRRIPSELSNAFWTSWAEGAASFDFATREADIGKRLRGKTAKAEASSETIDLLLRIE